MVTAIILSGGSGTRINPDVPKQYIEVEGKMIIDYSLEVFVNCEAIDYFCIIADSKWRESLEEIISEKNKDKFIGFAEPGEHRQISIFNGLRYINTMFEGNISDEDLVLIHDASRPNITCNMRMRYIYGVGTSDYDNTSFDGVVPALSVKNYIYQSLDGEKITGLLERDTLYSGQSPEVYMFKKYLKANEALLPDRIKEIRGSAEPAFMAGMNILLVEGSTRNYQITTQEDLDRFVREQMNRNMLIKKTEAE